MKTFVKFLLVFSVILIIAGLKEILTFTEYHAMMIGIGLIFFGVVLFVISNKHYINNKIEELYEEELRKYHANRSGYEGDLESLSSYSGTDPHEEQKENIR